ncbi:hypothetical protein F2Q68_00017274 [Brassica cretica]|uniref:Uncharacterized protein n=1 Tax=Brassica cretica TaxID=69181 RepID=A0A8S9HVW3_BRACR|nr:hypothetical protein F2Q68_00017274 [Brassica cretica]
MRKRTAEIASCVLCFVAEFKFEFLGLIRFDFETSTTGIAAVSVASPPPPSRPSSPTPPPSRSISEALDIHFSGACVELEHGLVNCGADLAILFVWCGS